MNKTLYNLSNPRVKYNTLYLITITIQCGLSLSV